VRREAEEALALAQRLAHEAHVPLLQVAQAPVDQPPRPGRRAGADVLLFQERHPQAARGGVAGDAGAVDPGPDNYEVEGDGGGRLGADRAVFSAVDHAQATRSRSLSWKLAM
jgi:hypothetical protein